MSDIINTIELGEEKGLDKLFEHAFSRLEYLKLTYEADITEVAAVLQQLERIVQDIKSKSTTHLTGKVDVYSELAWHIQHLSLWGSSYLWGGGAVAVLSYLTHHRAWNLARALDRARARDLALDLALALALDLARTLALALDRTLDLALDLAWDLARTQTRNQDLDIWMAPTTEYIALIESIKKDTRLVGGSQQLRKLGFDLHHTRDFDGRLQKAHIGLTALAEHLENWEDKAPEGLIEELQNLGLITSHLPDISTYLKEENRTPDSSPTNPSDDTTVEDKKSQHSVQASPIAPWNLTLHIKDKDINFQDTSVLLYTLSKSFHAIPGVSIDFKDIRKGSLFLKLKMIFEDSSSKKATIDLLEALGTSLTEGDRPANQQLDQQEGTFLEEEEKLQIAESDILFQAQLQELSQLAIEEKKLELAAKRIELLAAKEDLIAKRLENTVKLTQMLGDGLENYRDVELRINDLSFLLKENGKYRVENEIRDIDGAGDMGDIGLDNKTIV